MPETGCSIPSAAAGTTNFAARLRRLASIGIDVSPVGAAVAQAKFAYASWNEVTILATRILNESPATDVPEGPFWELCYDPRTLQDICKLREALLQNCETDARILTGDGVWTTETCAATGRMLSGVAPVQVTPKGDIRLERVQYDGGPRWTRTTYLRGSGHPALCEGIVPIRRGRCAVAGIMLCELSTVRTTVAGRYRV